MAKWKECSLSLKVMQINMPIVRGSSRKPEVGSFRA